MYFYSEAFNASKQFYFVFFQEASGAIGAIGAALFAPFLRILAFTSPRANAHVR